MDFIRSVLIFTGLLTIGFGIIAEIKGCRGTNEIYYYNPCALEVGQEIETVAYEKSTSKHVTVKIEGCELMVVFRVIGIPPQRQVGDVLKFKVVKVNSELSYDVEVIKPEKDTTEKDTTGAPPTDP